MVEAELRRFARSDARCQALETIFGVGPIYAFHLLAEIGDARRFKRSRQVVRASGLDPCGDRAGKTASAEAASQSRDHVICPGCSSEQPPTAAAPPAPTTRSTRAPSERCGRGRARLTVARKIARRAYHLLSTVRGRARRYDRRSPDHLNPKTTRATIRP